MPSPIVGALYHIGWGQSGELGARCLDLAKLGATRGNARPFFMPAMWADIEQVQTKERLLPGDPDLTKM